MWVEKIRILSGRRAAGNAVIVIASVILVYLLVSLYFMNHFFVNTTVNEVDVSLKTGEDADRIMRAYVKNYSLCLMERNGEKEEITGREIGLKYKEENSMKEILGRQNSLKWIVTFFRVRKLYACDLFTYDEKALENKINGLNCLNNNRIRPENVGFHYSGGSYELVKEVYGNIIRRERLNAVIRTGISRGETVFDLNETLCYENPEYTLNSPKTLHTGDLLNKYVSTSITYVFGSKKETLDGNIIHLWLRVNDELEVEINKSSAAEYVRGLGKKYDTVGIARSFQTSLGKVIEVNGGIYGWKINQSAETEALLENISHGLVIFKEPVYTQTAVSREGNEIGNTYVEINITRQHLWFYKDGKLIAHGPVVTGNPGRGNATVVGTYMLNYKQRDALLTGPGYAAATKYWMPFYGNIGVHDASWRYSFGGEIYKRNGTHGCVNAPLYLAKVIFEHISEGIPIICYEEPE
ncbi:peptidoglycan binding domain-containing protein [Lachnospiraceae bacterium 54-53]